MTDSPFANLTWRERVTRRPIAVGLALSVLFHAVMMWRWLPDVRHASSELAENAEGRSSLSVRIAPRAPAPSAPSAPSPSAQAQRSPTRRAEVPRAPARPHRTPPVLAMNKPVAPSTPAPAPPAVTPAPPQPRASSDGDLASYVESRRRERGESIAAAPSSESPAVSPTPENENARANRIAAANLGLDKRPTFGADANRGGGIFSIQRMSYDYAEFLFFGWNKDIRRNTTQLIEVRKGNNSDIRLAVVRRMIGIIREHETADFVFESQRLGRNVTLSARMQDNAGLEDFMMREFFGNLRDP
jgi:hypothetical protein